MHTQVGSLSVQTDYMSGFNGRETFDTVDEVMMEIRESLSLSNINEVTYKNSFDPPFDRERREVVSPTGRFPQMPTNQDGDLNLKPNDWKVVGTQLLIALLISIALPSSLWVLSTPILSLTQCEYHIASSWFSLSTMHIQLYHSWFYGLYLLPILWIILDEFQLKMATLKRVWITLIMALLLVIICIADALWANGIGIFLWNALTISTLICIAVILSLYLFGYRTLYMMVPLLVPIAIVYAVYHVLILTIFDIEDDHHRHRHFFLFAVAYPVILHLVELLALKSIQYIQLPFSFSSCCTLSRCSVKRCRKRTDSDSEHEGTVPTMHHFDDIKLEEAVSEQYLFLVSSMMSMFISTLQHIGYLLLVLHGHFVEIAVLSVLDLVLEVLSRNNLWNEFYLKIRYKTTKRDFSTFLMCRTTQLYYGSKCITQYVPVMIIVMLNLLRIGLYSLF